MANDINLPNLISHLQVDLGNTSGLAADAARQGSAIGGSLGDSIRARLREATSHIPEIEIDADSSDLDRDVVRVRRELDELANKRIGIDISVADALKQLDELEPHLDRISREHHNVAITASVGGAWADIREIIDAAHAVPDEIDIDVDLDAGEAIAEAGLLDRVLGHVGDSSRGMLGPIASVSKLLGGLGAALGSVVPLAGSLVTSLEDAAPAAAVAVSALTGIVLTTTAVKLALSGVGDTLSAAMDPSKASEYDEALKKLAPSARSFAQEVKSLAPQLHDLQQTVQNRFFAGFDTELKNLAHADLPAVRTALTSTADTLNAMALGAGQAAATLGRNGTLGQALDGATKGLNNLQAVPGVVVTALGQLAAAAGPAFDRVTSAAARVAGKIGASLSSAFKSGALEKAIDDAIGVIDQLLRVGQNVFTILGNLFGAAAASGHGLFGTLETITGALAKATATKGFQDAIGALSEVMSTVATTVGPLLGKALGALGPVVTTLAPPVEQIVKLLGDSLGDVIDALAPVLVSLAGAVGQLLTALGPFIPLAGQLIVSLLPALIPLFDSLGQIIAACAPFFQQLADNLGAEIVPLFSALAPVLTQLLPPLVQIVQDLLPVLVNVLVQLAPSLSQLAVDFSNLLVALAPVIGQLLTFIAILIDHLAPALDKDLGFITNLVDKGMKYFSDVINGVVIPAVQIVSDLLNGRWADAWRTAKDVVAKGTSQAASSVASLRDRASSYLASLAATALAQGRAAGSNLLTGIASRGASAVSYVAGLPGRIRSAFGSANSILNGIGRSIISGLIGGIESMIPSLSGTLASITARIPDWKGPPKKDASLLTPAGKSLITGLIAGIDATTSSLKSKLGQVTTVIEKAIDVNASNKHKTSGLSSLLSTVEKDNSKLLTLAKSRDSVAAKLKTATAALDAATAARTKEASSISSGILSEANITTGHDQVNSADAVQVGLQQALAKAQTFAAAIAKLKKEGLNSTLLQQIADAGVAGGGATAQALANAAPAQIKAISALQAQLSKTATSTGTSVAGALYDSGVQAAQGLVNGLKSQQKAIEKQMETIAAAMVKAIKTKLKIHSPSRELDDVGVMTMAGLPVGFERMRAAVIRSAASVAGAAASAASAAAVVVPSLSPGALTAAAGASRGSGDTHNTFYLSGSDASPQGILDALSWRGLVGG